MLRSGQDLLPTFEGRNRTPLKSDSWAGKMSWRKEWLPIQYSWASLVAQLVKNPPTMRETWVGSLGWEDPLEKGMTIRSQYSGLEFSTDYSPWVTNSQT